MARQVRPVIRAKRKTYRRKAAAKPGNWNALRWIPRAFLWLIYEFPGIRAIWEHLKPPTEEEKKRRRPAYFAKSTDIRNPPDGFTLWAIQNGAIDHAWHMKLTHLR